METTNIQAMPMVNVSDMMNINDISSPVGKLIDNFVDSIDDNVVEIARYCETDKGTIGLLQSALVGLIVEKGDSWLEERPIVGYNHVVLVSKLMHIHNELFNKLTFICSHQVPELVRISINSNIKKSLQELRAIIKLVVQMHECINEKVHFYDRGDNFIRWFAQNVTERYIDAPTDHEENMQYVNAIFSQGPVFDRRLNNDSPNTLLEISGFDVRKFRKDLDNGVWFYGDTKNYLDLDSDYESDSDDE